MKLLDLARNNSNVILFNKKPNLRAEIKDNCLVSKGISLGAYDDENWEILDKDKEIRNRIEAAMNLVVDALVNRYNADCSGVHQLPLKSKNYDTWIFVNLDGNSYKLSLVPMTVQNNEK